MKNSIKLLFVLFIGVTLITMSCKKETTPSVTTADVTAIEQTSVTAGGEVTDDGGADVTERGVCYSRTDANPTIADSKTTDGAGTGAFESKVTGLLNNTTYYVRAYATNSVGTSYGAVIEFKTKN
jgi:hypothetical protein